MINNHKPLAANIFRNITANITASTSLILQKYRDFMVWKSYKIKFTNTKGQQRFHSFEKLLRERLGLLNSWPDATHRMKYPTKSDPPQAITTQPMGTVNPTSVCAVYISSPVWRRNRWLHLLYCLFRIEAGHITTSLPPGGHNVEYSSL